MAEHSYVECHLYAEKAKVFFVKSFHPSLMFMGKTRAYLMETSLRCSALW